MTFWLVKAKPRAEKLRELRRRLDSGEISKMRPFGESLDEGLRNARIRIKDGYALWEEEDYCHPPLAQEREAVLDDYFNDITVVDIGDPGNGWKRVEKLTSLWTPPPENNTSSVTVLEQSPRHSRKCFRKLMRAELSS